MIYTVESEIKVSTERMRAQKTATILMLKVKVMKRGLIFGLMKVIRV